MNKKVLLHACCAPCGGHIINELQKDGFDVSVFYFNPNIYPEKEYIIRRDEMKKYCEEIGVGFIEILTSPNPSLNKNFSFRKFLRRGSYKIFHGDWLEKIKGLEKESEGGKRCEICYKMRMGKTAEHAKQNNFDYFETSLSISPHKNYEKIKKIGDDLVERYGLNFIGRNWKKKDGFKCSCELSKANNFYRQNYCGCEFSHKSTRLRLST
jgi:predicted adenine nucleotide alpha hydrolase (AANH) superfamily ATPase